MIRKKLTMFEFAVLVSVSLFTSLRVKSGSLQTIEISCFALLFFSLFLSREHLLYLLSFILPLGNLYKFQSGLMLYSVIVLIYCIKSLLYDLISKKSNHEIISYIIWFYSFLISLFSSTIYNTTLQLQLVFYFHLLFILLTIKVNLFFKDDYYYNILYCFIAGTFIVCLLSALFPDISFLISRNANEESLINAGFSTVWDFGRSTLVSISFVIVLFFNKKINSFFSICLIAFFLYALTRSARFSMLLGLVSMFASSFYYYTRNNKSKALLNIFLFFLLPICLYFVISETYNSMIETRGYEASDNGRYEIWEKYLSYLYNHSYVILFGTGAGTISDIAQRLNIATAHNIFLEKTIEFGIFGIIVLCTFFISLYNSFSLNLKKNVKLIPLFTFLGTCLTQGTTGSLSFALLLSIFPLIDTKDTKGDPNNEFISTSESSL